MHNEGRGLDVRSHHVIIRGLLRRIKAHH
jgi:hypothetical protein